jgi:hypothetical protein
MRTFKSNFNEFSELGVLAGKTKYYQFITPIVAIK